MNFLLDTHGLIWFLTGEAQLSVTARSLIEDDSNRIYISIASLWEMAIRFSVGKLNVGQSFEALFPAQLDANDIAILEISVAHLKEVCKLPFHHRDPFDRLLVVQALTENWPVISADAVLDSYRVHRI